MRDSINHLEWAINTIRDRERFGLDDYGAALARERRAKGVMVEAVKELQTLRTALKDMKEALEFYGGNSSWCGNKAYLWVNIDFSDVENASMDDSFDVPVTPRIGGKRAREALKKHEEILRGVE